MFENLLPHMVSEAPSTLLRTSSGRFLSDRGEEVASNRLEPSIRVTRYSGCVLELHFIIQIIIISKNNSVGSKKFAVDFF